MYHVSRRSGACPRLAVGSCNFNPSAGEFEHIPFTGTKR